ncbi:hypothetical protein EDD16DRAFT_295823 [Pisolithus croceorrhizus]|nr:hypothetical protein EDD16DRAFT_295823 [Pisolithus croceorrhizus]
MQAPSSPCSGPSEASKPPQYSSKDLRSLLEDVIRVANVAKSLLRACGGLREASGSRAQPPTDSASCSPRCTYSFCFFCGQKGHIRANCDSCKKYLATGKCLLVKGRIVLPTGREIPREVPGRTLKDCLDCWDLGNRSNDNRKPPSSQGRLPSEDVGSRKPQTQMVPLGVSQPRSTVHPLEKYLHQTLVVNLPLALVISKTCARTRIQAGHAAQNLPLALATSTTRAHTRIQVGRAAPIPATTPETTSTTMSARHHLRHDLHTRVYRKVQGMSPPQSSPPAG